MKIALSSRSSNIPWNLKNLFFLMGILPFSPQHGSIHHDDIFNPNRCFVSFCCEMFDCIYSYEHNGCPSWVSLRIGLPFLSYIYLLFNFLSKVLTVILYFQINQPMVHFDFDKYCQLPVRSERYKQVEDWVSRNSTLSRMKPTVVLTDDDRFIDIELNWESGWESSINGVI